MTCMALMLAACSKSEPAEATGAEKQIKTTSAIEGVGSKGVIAGADAALSGLTFLRIDDANASLADFDFSGVSEITGSSRAIGGAITFGLSQNYDKAGNKTAYLRGFTTENATVTTGEKAVWAIDGATDVLLTDVWNAGNYLAPVIGEVIFRHQLSRVEVICQGEQSVAASVMQAIWGDVASIELVNASPELTYTYAANAVTATGAPVDFALLKGTAYDAAQTFAATAIPAYGNTVVAGSAMVFPQTSAVTLKVTTAMKGDKEILTTLGALERAKIHKITLTFNTDGKTITPSVSTIEEWTDGTPGSGTVPTP